MKRGPSKNIVIVQQPLCPSRAWNVPGMCYCSASTHCPRRVLSGSMSAWNIIVQAGLRNFTEAPLILMIEPDSTLGLQLCKL